MSFEDTIIMYEKDGALFLYKLQNLDSQFSAKLGGATPELPPTH